MAGPVLAPHTARNYRPILEVLRTEFRAVKSVLEVGSGNGQHATKISGELGDIVWQTSDRSQNHEVIRDWLSQSALPNVLAPISLDVLVDPCPAAHYDAVFSANTAHIMSMQAVEKMFEIVARVLRIGGVFCLYGPFRQDGKFNCDSNSGFHHSLQRQDAAMGIRDLETMHEFAASGGLHRQGLYAVPANNLMIIWRRIEEEM